MAHETSCPLTREQFILAITIDDSSEQACFDSIERLNAHARDNLNRVDWRSGDAASAALRHVSTIRLFLDHKRRACRFRSKGLIPIADRLESEAERYYAQIPEDWRW